VKPLALAALSDDVPWRDSPHAGVQWKKLFFDPATGESAVLLRFAPGSSYGAHRHPGGEQYFVLSGSLEDGGSTWGAGSYVRHAPGSSHRPSSKAGALIFVLLPRPIEALPGSASDPSPDSGLR
jgi:anti-sigma factor ChrR (cupin superfamily)